MRQPRNAEKIRLTMAIAAFFGAAADDCTTAPRPSQSRSLAGPIAKSRLSCEW
jgi:hypothetical protein